MKNLRISEKIKDGKLKSLRLISNMMVILIGFLVVFFIPSTANAIPAFPGCEGFGCPSNIGGRGGTVIKVTNTNNSGSGSLRAALTASGPRIVIFTVGGTINLSSNIVIDNPYVTVAGQTAPGGGIQVAGRNFTLRTHNVIIRGLRLRPGPNSDQTAGIEFNASSRDVHDVAIDHNSFQYAHEETISFWSGSSTSASPIYNTTFSWNIVADPLYAGGLSYGFLTNPNAEQLTIHHNLFTNNRIRSPRIGNDNYDLELINNVIFNTGNEATRTNSGMYYVKNLYVEGDGPSAAPGDYFLQVSGGTPNQGATVYVLGNVGPGRTSDTGSEWDMVSGNEGTYRDPDPFTQWTLSGVTETNISDVKTVVLAGVGATAPSRDALDQAAIDEVTNESGGNNNLSSPSARANCSGCSGGYPNLSAGSPPTDSDNDGIPDAWENSRGLNANNASDANEDRNGDGYTNIEEYINELLPAVAVSSPPPTPNLVPLPPFSLTIE